MKKITTEDSEETIKLTGIDLVAHVCIQCGNDYPCIFIGGPADVECDDGDFEEVEFASVVKFLEAMNHAN